MTCRRILVTAILPFVIASPNAFAFREYVPSECHEQNEDFSHPDRYRDCLLSLMQVEPAEALRAARKTAYRLLATVDSPAMPIFIEFGRAQGGGSWLKLHSASPNAHPFSARISAARWSTIDDHGRKEVVQNDGHRPSAPVGPSAHTGIETVCIPEGSMDLEFILPGHVIRKYVDLCDRKRAAFADFLLQQAVKAAGNCAATAPAGVSDVKRLERCQLPLTPPSPPEGERE
jgi:hypothetical protein